MSIFQVNTQKKKMTDFRFVGTVFLIAVTIANALCPSNYSYNQLWSALNAKDPSLYLYLFGFELKKNCCIKCAQKKNSDWSENEPCCLGVDIEVDTPNIFTYYYQDTICKRTTNCPCGLKKGNCDCGAFQFFNFTDFPQELANLDQLQVFVVNYWDTYNGKIFGTKLNVIEHASFFLKKMERHISWIIRTVK